MKCKNSLTLLSAGVFSLVMGLSSCNSAEAPFERGKTSEAEVVRPLPANLTLPEGFVRSAGPRNYSFAYSNYAKDFQDNTVLPPPPSGGNVNDEFPGPDVDPINPSGDLKEWIATLRDKGLFLERIYNVTLDTSTTERFVFDTGKDVLYPGNVLLSGDLRTGEFTPLAGHKTNDITISNRLVSLGAPMSPQTFQPSLSGFNQTMQNWFANDTKETSLRTIVELQEVVTEKNGGFNLGASFDAKVVEIISSLSVESRKKKTHVVLKLIQSAYNIAMDVPKDNFLLDFKRDGITDGHVPVYVSNIEYGRAYYVVFSSDYSTSQIKLAFGLTPKVESVGDVKLEAYYQKVRSETDVKAVLLGGSSVEHSALVQGDWQSFRAGLANPISLTACEPIAYGFRYVDTNQQARIVVSHDRQHKQTLFVPECKELRVRMRPDGVRATAGLKWIGKVRLCGIGTVTIGAKEYKIFDVPPKSYFNIEKMTTDYVKLPEPQFAWSELAIKMPADIQTLSNQKVTFKFDLSQAWASGRKAETGLGKCQFDMSVADLLFYAQNGGFSVKVRDTRLMDYMADLHIEMTPFTTVE